MVVDVYGVVVLVSLMEFIPHNPFLLVVSVYEHDGESLKTYHALPLSMEEDSKVLDSKNIVGGRWWLKLEGEGLKTYS